VRPLLLSCRFPFGTIEESNRRNTPKDVGEAREVANPVLSNPRREVIGKAAGGNGFWPARPQPAQTCGSTARRGGNR
jgi:hypothetical protein